jgi:hypothetical protein
MNTHKSLLQFLAKKFSFENMTTQQQIIQMASSYDFALPAE